MFSTIKMAIAVMLITGIAGAGMYVMKLRADNATLKANQLKLETAITEQNKVLEQQKADFTAILESNKNLIQKEASVYSFFGRKRRLPNVKSDNKGIIGHEVRSGLNFLVQSAASDINLIGGFNSSIPSKPFISEPLIQITFFEYFERVFLNHHLVNRTFHSFLEIKHLHL